MPPREQLWIGMVEISALEDSSDFLYDMTEAFVIVVTWAYSAKRYRRKAERILRELASLYVSDVILPEPVAARRARTSGRFADDIEDMIVRAEANPRSTIYRTFHNYSKGDA